MLANQSFVFGIIWPTQFVNPCDSVFDLNVVHVFTCPINWRLIWIHNWAWPRYLPRLLWVSWIKITMWWLYIFILWMSNIHVLRVSYSLVWIETLIRVEVLLTWQFLLNFRNTFENVNGSQLILNIHLLHLFKNHLLCITILLYVHKLGFKWATSTVRIVTLGESQSFNNVFLVIATMVSKIWLFNIWFNYLISELPLLMDWLLISLNIHRFISGIVKRISMGVGSAYISTWCSFIHIFILFLVWDVNVFSMTTTYFT